MASRIVTSRPSTWPGMIEPVSISMPGSEARYRQA